MNPVIQEETTGCGIASVANKVGKSYSELKKLANAMGILTSNIRTDFSEMNPKWFIEVKLA